MGGARRTDPETSKMAYETMKADGTLSKRRLEAAACLASAHNPPTVGEMAAQMRTNRNNLATRMTELEHLGIARKVSERECKVSEKICLTWELTGATTPTGEIPKNINTTEIIRKQRDKAEARLKALEELVASVAGWLKDDSHDHSRHQLTKGANRIEARMKDILGKGATIGKT